MVVPEPLRAVAYLQRHVPLTCFRVAKNACELGLSYAAFLVRVRTTANKQILVLADRQRLFECRNHRAVLMDQALVKAGGEFLDGEVLVCHTAPVVGDYVWDSHLSEELPNGLVAGAGDDDELNLHLMDQLLQRVIVALLEVTELLLEHEVVLLGASVEVALTD